VIEALIIYWAGVLSGSVISISGLLIWAKWSVARALR